MAWLTAGRMLLGRVLFLYVPRRHAEPVQARDRPLDAPRGSRQRGAGRAIAAATDWLAKNTAGILPAGISTAPDAAGEHGRGRTAAAGNFSTARSIWSTGAPVARETLGGEFFYRLHFELHFPLSPGGGGSPRSPRW